jgi:hypothetical protein
MVSDDALRQARDSGGASAAQGPSARAAGSAESPSARGRFCGARTAENWHALPLVDAAARGGRWVAFWCRGVVQDARSSTCFHVFVSLQ